jgi:hypothetical protein
VIRAPGFAPSPAKKPLDPYRELISHQVGNIVYNETWGLYDNDSKPESNPELDSARFAISHATRSGEHWLDPPSHVTDLVRSVPPEALGTYRTCQRIAEAADREREHGMDSAGSIVHWTMSFGENKRYDSNQGKWVAAPKGYMGTWLKSYGPFYNSSANGHLPRGNGIFINLYSEPAPDRWLKPEYRTRRTTHQHTRRRIKCARDLPG